MQPTARALLASAAAMLGIALTSAAQGERPQPFPGVLDEHPAIQYAARPTHDRIAALNRAIEEGAASLEYRAQGGYLASVLDALGISPESQLLVFSKTGIQSAVTSPQNPRALYFDDSAVVGYIAGAPMLEFAVQDPEQGVIFYTLDQRAGARPHFTRKTMCLSCHVSAGTMEVPGLINRSMFTRADGSVIPKLGSSAVDHRTPLLQRWGGMYVTGNYSTPFYGRAEHLGNITVSELDDARAVTTSNEALIAWQNSEPESRGYPSAESDIAGFLVFDHQAHAVNLLTRLGWEVRVAASEGAVDFARGQLRQLVDDVADYFLFVSEEPPPARLSPRAGFAKPFEAVGPRDRRGRSLRELDLDTRLLRYPCSYMVYSAAFGALPNGAKRAVYQRMWSILSGRDASPKYAHLSAADRRAVMEILQETKKDLPDTESLKH